MSESGQRTDVTTTSRAQAAAAIVGRLNAAVKSRRLYGPGHPLNPRTVTALLESVVSFHERFGSFVLETHRDGLVVEGKPFEGGESVQNLALLLYAMGVWQLVFLPGITEAEVGELLAVVTLDREAILAGGGLVQLLAKRSVNHVRVVELRPGEEDAANISLAVYRRLLDGSLEPQDRVTLIGLLRAGPEQARRLLSVIIDRTKQASSAGTKEELAARMYSALAALDRLIVDTPQGESRALLRHLAEAALELDSPERQDLHRTILARTAEDLSARALLSAMTSGQIARMVIPCLETTDPPPQLAQVVQGLPFDPEKARETIALISQQTGRTFDLPVVLEELTLPQWMRNIQRDLTDFHMTDAEVAVSEDEIQALLAEVQIDDQVLAKEQVLMLLQLCIEEHDSPELEANLDALVRGTETLLQRGTTDALPTVLRTLDALVAEGGPRAKASLAALHKLIMTPVGKVTVKDVWGWTAEHALLKSLREVGRSASTALAQALSTERDPGRRQVIAAILAKLGDEYAEALSQYLADPNPEVVRQIVHILSQMRTPKAIGYLRMAARHPEVRIRKEVLEALVRTQAREAQDVLLTFLHDPEPEIREQCLVYLQPDTARQAMSELVAMLGDHRDRTASLRIQIIETLKRTNAVDVLPALRRISSPWKLRSQDRTVARHARRAIAFLMRPPVENAGRPRGATS